MAPSAPQPGLTLGSRIAAAAARFPDRAALIDPAGSTATNAELLARAEAAAALLEARGVAAGDRVATVAENAIDLLASMYGAWWLGAIFVPLNPAHHPSALASMLAKADPQLCLLDREQRRRGGELGVRAIDLEEVRAPGSPSAGPRWQRPAVPAAIYFSSGTTGRSKACVMSHDYLAWTGEEFCRCTELGAGDVVHTLGPFHHVNALWAYAGSVTNGSPHAFEVKFSASRFWQRMAETGATVFDYVGAIVSILLRTPGGPAAGARPLKGVGGGARGAEIERFERRFGGALLECYGLTECTLPIYQRRDERRVGSIGKLSDYFDARIVDEHGAEVAPLAAGELWLRPRRGRGMFSGYWEDDAATAEAFAGEWFKTGDQVWVDADGYYHYVDRNSQVIRRRGENISAYDLEGILLEHPKVLRCAAVGVPSDLGDDDVLVAVEPVAGQSLEPGELLSWAGSRMAKFMVPRYVRILDALPMTGSERVEKHRLRSEGVAADTFDADGAESQGVSTRGEERER